MMQMDSIIWEYYGTHRIGRNQFGQSSDGLVADGDFSSFEGSFVNFGWQSYYDHVAPEMAMFEQPHYRVSEIRPFVSGPLAYATFSWGMDVTVISDKVAGGRHPVAGRRRVAAAVRRRPCDGADAGAAAGACG